MKILVLCSSQRGKQCIGEFYLAKGNRKKNDVYPDIPDVHDSIKEMTVYLQTLSCVSLRKHYFV